MAYLLLLPVAYYSTQHVANKLFNLTTDYVLEREALRDESKALLVAATSVLCQYKDMDEDDPAFQSKVLVEDAIDSLKYVSDTTREKWFKANYSAENSKLCKLQNELEKRLRLFLLVVNTASGGKKSK